MSTRPEKSLLLPELPFVESLALRLEASAVAAALSTTAKTVASSSILFGTPSPDLLQKEGT
jgi:hypothetical protein